MAKIFGWYQKRVGKQFRVAAVNCGGMGLSWAGRSQYIVCVEAMAEETQTDENVRESRLRIELTPREARGLAEQLVEWAAKAEAEKLPPGEQS